MILAPFLALTNDTNEWNHKYSVALGPLASNHPIDCHFKRYYFDEVLPLSQIQKSLDIANPQQIVYLLNEPCGMWQNHKNQANFLYQTLPRK